jgi:hypothetical protein
MLRRGLSSPNFGRCAVTSREESTMAPNLSKRTIVNALVSHADGGTFKDNTPTRLAASSSASTN